MRSGLFGPPTLASVVKKLNKKVFSSGFIKKNIQFRDQVSSEVSKMISHNDRIRLTALKSNVSKQQIK